MTDEKISTHFLEDYDEVVHYKTLVYTTYRFNTENGYLVVSIKVDPSSRTYSLSGSGTIGTTKEIEEHTSALLRLTEFVADNSLVRGE